MSFVNFSDTEGRLLGQVPCDRPGWHLIPLTISARIIAPTDQLAQQLLALQQGELVGLFRLTRDLGGNQVVEIQMSTKEQAEQLLRDAQVGYGGTESAVFRAGFASVAPESEVAADSHIIRETVESQG